MLGARRGVHTGYVAASERSGALLIGAERPAEGAGLLLIGQERLADLAAWLLIDDERLSDLAAWLQIDTERPPESSEGLSINLGQRVVRRCRPLLHHVQRLARLGLHAVRRRELERLEQREPSCLHEWPSRDKRRQSQVLEQLHGQLRLPAHRLRLGQVEQSVQYVVNGRHVLVLQLVGSPQVVAGEVLAREPAVGRVLLLAGRVYPIYGLNQHLVLASRW